MVASHELTIDGKGGAGLGCGIPDKLCTIIEAEEVPTEDEADSDTSDQVGSKAREAESQQLLERMQKTRKAIAARETELRAAQPSLASRPLLELNSEATKLSKSCDYIGALAVYGILFRRAATLNLTHPELYVCYSNASAACLELELYEEALEYAVKCARLAEASLRRNFKGSASYIKSFVRKGRALLGLERYREAATAFESGLKLDPLNPGLKLGLQEANQGVLKDLVKGKGHERRAITYPMTSQRITFHPYSAPLHRVRAEDELPVKLLTPFQAENDHHVKDTYNYMTVQADVRMPSRQYKALEDEYYVKQWRTAIQAAVTDKEKEEDVDARVLNLGAGAGLLPSFALKAGARHVTATERWLYLALACKETLEENKFDEDIYSVVYKRPTDLRIQQDVPVCCNVIIANVLDEGLLTAGLLPSVRHALSALATHDAVVLPASATVYMQAVELRTETVCGLDMSAANLYRWHPAHATGAALDLSKVRTLSNPVEVWHFDLGTPPEKSATKKVDVEFVADGKMNAIVFWYRLHLYGDVYLTTGPEAAHQAPGLRYLQPAIQYLAGELRVEADTLMPIVAMHNTVRMRFDIEAAEYLHLAKPDASFPHNHFCMLADEGRLAAYDRAITRAVARCKQGDGANSEAHVLDMGTGTGALALMAARAGATSVVAADLHASLCDVARKAAAANGLSKRVTVVQRDVALLERGREVRALGVNVVVADIFDAGLLGDQFQYLLELTKRKVVQPGAAVIPSAATVYCMGIEALTADVEGIALSSFNKYRWDADYTPIQLKDLPHRRLTRPARVTEIFFDSERRPRGSGRDALVKLDVIAPGMLNAVVFWFDLHLDDEETLSNAPLDALNPVEEASGAGRATCTASPLQGQHDNAVVVKGDEDQVHIVHNDGISSTESEKPASMPQTDQQQGISEDLAQHQQDDGSFPPAPTPMQRQQHHWGQALQYLDRMVSVEPGRKATLLARRDGSKLRFALRQGVGDWVGRAPWKIEWGGGASVENPHFQRVHYCELLVRDFLMRCRSKRFPSVEKDVALVLAHSGSLHLDVAALQEAGHELVVLERLHSDPEFSPGASLQAITKRPLRLC